MGPGLHCSRLPFPSITKVAINESSGLEISEGFGDSVAAAVIARLRFGRKLRFLSVGVGTLILVHTSSYRGDGLEGMTAS